MLTEAGGGAFAALALAAATIGALHALAPDHWAPFAAVARARGWSAARTAKVTVLCGVGHVTGSVALALLALTLGVELFTRLGGRLEALAGVMLIGFGLAYAVWGLRRATRGRLHSHGNGARDPSRLTARSLFVLFTADPCVAVIPLLLASVSLGWARTLAVILTYEMAMLATMLTLVMPARAGLSHLKMHWIDHWGDAAAGLCIALVGIAVTLLGW
jgi:nickel/cobalt exporter